MKTAIIAPAQRLYRLRFFVVALTAIWCCTTPEAHAGLTLEMNVVRYDQSGYYFSPNLMTNSTPPNITFGDYQVVSPQSPTNGISPFLFRFDANGFNYAGGFSWGYGDFASMMQGLTNGTWSIFVTNTTTTNVFHFKVTASISSNDMPYVSITFPTNGAVNVTNQPTFTWKGPTNYNNLVLYYYNNGPTLPVTQTSLLSSVLYQGINNLTVHYDSNSTTAVVSSVPTNNASQPISSWVSTAHLQDYSGSQFTVGTVDGSGTSHTLIAHYTWDATNMDGTASDADSSGNAYDMNFGGSFGSSDGADSTTDHTAGPRAIQFQNGDGNSADYVGWNPSRTNLLTALSGSFSISCWIKTTQNNFGWDQAPAYYGAGIVTADNGGPANDVVPIALTGNTIGFNTGGDEDVTLNSIAAVNDGNYHHIVVTRNQPTGQKIIYIDGVLDGFSSGTTNLLNDPQIITIGALSDAGNPDQNGTTYFYNGYDGLLDDLQIYSGVLSSNEVASLYANPGTTADQIINVPLLARYNFEITNDIFTAGTDSSGNGNDANCSTGNGGTNADTFSTDAAIGSYSREFKGDTVICFYQGSTTFNNISNAIYGSFSWTAWVKTTNSVNSDSANAYFGLPILAEYDGGMNQMILSITGHKAAFTTGNPNGGSDTTLHSMTTVNDGNYHFLAATRDVASGMMKLYVDGNLEDTQISTNGPRILTYGLNMAGGNAYNYIGLLDDVRIYSGELSASDVATLSGHPISDFNDALNTTGFTWTTGGDTSWFVETTNTHDNVSAARSGSITDDTQTSYIETTVTGPGTLSFWWQTEADDFDFDLEFDIDGNYMDDIYNNTSWSQDTFHLDSGQHTLRWTAFAYDIIPGTDAGYLDQVSFIPDSSFPPPAITLQPLDQTNYPGYKAALLADSTNSPAPAWQWYTVGSGLISGATNKLYTPPNSGTAAVAGSYFAVATGVNGSTTSRTAVVTFANAALPADWSRAFNAQLYIYDGQSAQTNYGIACLLNSGGDVIYTANSFTGTNTFASDTLVSGGNRFAAGLFKHYTNGSALWGRAITNSGNGNSYPQCLAAAPGEGIYMSGVFSGTNGIGSTVLQETAGGSLYIVRFDAGGNVLWVRTFGGTNSQFQSYHELVSDPAGNVTISALGNNLVDFGTTNVLFNGQQGILVQYDLNGNIRWIQRPSGWVQYMTYDAGRIYVAFDSKTVNYIGGVTNISDRKWAVAALNATNGQALWVRGIGSGTNDNNPSGQSFDTPTIAVSGTNVFFTGTGWNSNAVFGAYSVSWPQITGQYLARYDTNGNAQLAVGFGGIRVAPWVAKADASGNVYLAGDFDGYASFGNKTIGGAHYDDIANGQFYGQMFLAQFDRNGSNIWVRQAMNPVSYVNVRDIALAADGVWADGFVNQNASFGSYSVSGPITCIGFPFCSLYYNVGGYLAKVGFLDTTAVSVDLKVDINHQQSTSSGDSFIVFPGFNSVTPPATGTTTNTVESPTGKFHAEVYPGGSGAGSFILSSLDQVINEFANGQWSLYINKGMPNQRLFHFTASVNGLTTNLLSAVKIITPTNGATGIPTNSPFRWFGPTNFSTLVVNKQKFDGTDQATSALPLTATNWPSPPGLAIGTNRFSVTYTSNNFPGITFSVPVDANSQSVSNWVPHFNLLSTAASIYVVSAGSSSVQLINPGVTATSFQFSFTSPAGVTNSIQYRTNLTAGSNWQTYSNVVGNGSLQTIQIPLSIFSPAQQGFIRILMP